MSTELSYYWERVARSTSKEISTTPDIVPVQRYHRVTTHSTSGHPEYARLVARKYAERSPSIGGGNATPVNTSPSS